MNLVVLTGRLTRDPELKYGQSGNAYCRFSLAVDRPFKRGEADFINCVAFGKTAELIGEYLRKGRKAGVQGHLQMNKYESNGEKRTTYDVVVGQIEFLEGRNTEETKFNNNFSSQEPKVEKPKAPAPQDDFDDDEFPF